MIPTPDIATLSINTIRTLSLDAVQRANSGHPGLPLGMAPAAAEQAFTLGDGEVSPAIRTPQGFVFLTVTGKQEPYVPKLEEVKPRVRDDVLKQKAIEAAQQKATALAAQLKSGSTPLSGS